MRAYTINAEFNVADNIGDEGMKIVFIGSGHLAVPALRALCDDTQNEVAAVITQPDRPKGRRRQLESCPLNKVARELVLPVITPEKVNAPEILDELGGLCPDLIVVAAYGQFLSQKLLDIPKFGAINIHPSLLPKYRGAAPIQWALINGDEVAGVSIIFVTLAMDAGDIICQEECAIAPEETAAALECRLAKLGATLLLKALDDLHDECVKRVPQDVSQVILAPKFNKSDGCIDFSRSATEIANRVRGMNPWPCCFCEGAKGGSLRILLARAENGVGLPGEIIDVNRDGPLIAAGEGAVRLLEVQPAGKKKMSGWDYCNGYQLKPGCSLTQKE